MRNLESSPSAHRLPLLLHILCSAWDTWCHEQDRWASHEVSSRDLWSLEVILVGRALTSLPRSDMIPQVKTSWSRENIMIAYRSIREHPRARCFLPDGQAHPGKTKSKRQIPRYQDQAGSQKCCQWTWSWYLLSTFCHFCWVSELWKYYANW